MKVKSVYLKNYIGIYNGLGLEEIKIDFSKGKNKIVLIKGDNGSGKTTLFKSLTPLPDSPDSFIPGKCAVKIIEYYDNLLVYKIEYVHDVKADGSRTSKAYITRQDPCTGEVTRYNENGNMTSAKDLIYEFFKLDANFIALSQLSSEDRGLADKRPAERKRFINSIIDTLTVYNDMYKSLSKRSSLFKSMINSLTNKIGNLGNEENIKMALASLENRINIANQNKQLLIGKIAIDSNKILEIDPKGEIRRIYDGLATELSKLNTEFKGWNDCRIVLDNKLASKIGHKVDISDTDRIKDNYNKTINENAIKIGVLESKNEMLLTSRDTEAKKLQEKTQRLKSLTDDNRYMELKSTIKSYHDELNRHRDTLNDISLNVDLLNISKEEYITGINILNDIKESISHLKSQASYENMQVSINDYMMKGIDISEAEFEHDGELIECLKSNYEMAVSDYNKYSNIKLLADRINTIPKDCKLGNECEFVKDIIAASKEKPDEKLENITNYINAMEKGMKVSTEELNRKRDVQFCISFFKGICNQLDKYKGIISKLPNTENFINIDVFLKKILDGYKFEEVDRLYKLIDYGNMIDMYNSIKQALSKLEIEFANYNGRDELVKSIMKDIEILNKNINETGSEIEKNNITIYNCRVNINKLKETISIIESVIENNTKLEELQVKINSVTEDINKISDNIKYIKECETSVVNMENRLRELDERELKPMVDDRDKLKHALKLLEEYNVELAEYKAKYDKSETIKFHCSPTTGIQVIFMEVYMNKIIDMANKLLSYLFDGEFVINQFVINEDEFRIPCIGRGLMVDDISSMSTSQICMISMILSFALLYHSSTKYNILRLDEIDGGLDTRNRLQFIKLLDSQMEILKCEQCILISHNSELNSDNIDVIVLKNKDVSSQINGNIIYQY